MPIYFLDCRCKIDFKFTYVRNSFFFIVNENYFNNVRDGNWYQGIYVMFFNKLKNELAIKSDQREYVTFSTRHATCM